jgi:glutamate/tyrosine decarboxylase-like PLP-dependent enzyme
MPDPRQILFPDRGERERVEDGLTRSLIESIQRITKGRVAPSLNVEDMRAALSEFDFGTPRPLEGLLSWTLEKLEHGLVHLTHPRYFGLFNPAPVFPAECADRVAAALNPQLASSGTSPAAVEIEAHVIRAIATRAGLPSTAFGHFTSGGSEANYTALLCALMQSEPGFAETGTRAFAGDPVFYTSRDCHIAWLKIAHQVGIGRAALRLVATDTRGRMRVDALETLMAADRALGRVPVMIVSTAGTTSAGAIDPLAQCAQIARDHGVWHHVDAAWGGAAIASDRLRPLLGGIELADSVTVDAHKWFATTMGCGMVLLRQPEILQRVFQVSANFMPSNVAGLDPYVTTAQWSRRFLGLRLFLSLGAAGWAGYAAHIEHAVALTESIRRRLEALVWTTVNDPLLAVLCVAPPAGSRDPAELVRRVVASGNAWVAPTRFDGQAVVRICVTNGQSSDSDVEALVAALQAAC